MPPINNSDANDRANIKIDQLGGSNIRSQQLPSQTHHMLA